MDPEKRQATSNPISVGVLIVSEVCFLRESLGEILTHTPGIQIRGQSATLVHAVAIAKAQRPAILLLDVAFPGGMGAAAQLSAAAPGASVVALGLAETEENVLAWAESGVAGYVPNTASVDDLVSLIKQVSRGEQTCPSRIAGSLIRRIAMPGGRAGRRLSAPPAALLTHREIEILGLLDEGLSNKGIARRLSISLGTTKSHVHNLLAKLGVQRRAEAMTSFHILRHSRVDASIF
jgi:two-component system, NarL family, nitrate/nitrite response regulator NarL